MTNNTFSFAEFSQSNPCFGCPAPCCRMQLIPCKIPASFKDLDYVRYMLLFPDTEAIVKQDGGWGLIKWVQCGAFDDQKFLCTLHNTPEKPQICSTYDAHNCWYKKSFVLTDSQELYRLNSARFEVWIKEIQFAENGNIISAPDFNRSLELLKDIPIEPNFAQSNKIVLTVAGQTF